MADRPNYTGHVADAQTGMDYMQQRYYDPMIGRFLSVDPVTADPKTGAHFNRYWYAANNPYRFMDPDGRCEKATGSHLCSNSSTKSSPFSGGNSSGTASAAGFVRNGTFRGPAEEQFAMGGKSDSKDTSGSEVLQIENPIFSFPGVPDIEGFVLTSYQFEHHIKQRHAADLGPEDAGRFYSPILNSNTPQRSFSQFLRIAISTGAVTFSSYRGGGLRMYVDLAEPIGVTPSGRPTSQLAVGIAPAATPGFWAIITVFPAGR